MRQRERTPESKPLPIQVSFLPERRKIGVVVRKIRSTGHAYPLFNIAALFLSHQGDYLVKLEIGRQQKASDVTLYQCRTCKAVFLREDMSRIHALAQHLDGFYDVEEIVADPPSGNFVCVSRCTLSGELLGPPNHHSFGEQLQELRRRRFPHLSMEAYRSHIETVRDEALVEQWKEQARKQTIYILKGGGDHQHRMKRADAEAHFLSEVVPTFVKKATRVVISSDDSRRIEDADLRLAIRDAWNRDSKFPLSMALALRPALRHMGCHFFKANKQTFVTSIHPRPIDPAQTVSPIRGVLRYMHDHPGCTRDDLIRGLRPGAPADAPSVAEVLTPLRWLIERGHVIEFFNGTLSVPRSKEHEARSSLS